MKMNIYTRCIKMHGLTELPWYIGGNDKLHLAIWNCGMRPQNRLQVLKDIRITIRQGSRLLFVIKKGDL